MALVQRELLAMTDLLLVGRVALNAHLPGTAYRTPDTDYIATSNAAEKWVLEMKCPYKWEGLKKLIAFPKHDGPIEFEIAWPGSTGWELLERHPDQRMDIATLPELLALKLSHRYLRNSPHFEKTRHDILLLRNYRVTVPDDLTDWLKRREKETLSYPAPKLNTNRKGFFTDNVPYTYVHDTIHLAVARGQVPAYTLFQKDGEEVMVDRNKWNALPYEVQLNSVLEEAAVLALERHQIPNRFKPEQDESFKMALQKVCTSISSGWWREFAWENYDKALAVPYDYVWAFKQGLANGIVKEVA